jgi:hypothetical protein
MSRMVAPLQEPAMFDLLKRRRASPRPGPFRPLLEPLEDRSLPSTFVVATNGNDSNLGTAAQPFATIQHALDVAANPGDTVQVRGGTYAEKIAFSHGGSAAGGFITLEPFANEHPLLDGTGLPSSDVGFGNDMVLIHNVSYVKLVGFEIAHDTGLTDDNDGSGVRIQGFGNHVEVRDNVIHDIHGTGGAMGISVYGISLAHPLNHVVIDGNQVFDCDPGQSEALTLNGNVVNFQVTSNTVHDVDNIGIDMIGGEFSIFGLAGPRANLPVARNGVCSHNTVFHASSGDPVNNPAGGIYVDGGRNILVSDNVSDQNDLGIEVAAENPGYVAGGIVVENNVLYGNSNAGLAFGGFARAVGRTRNSRFINNTLYKNDTANTGNGQLWIQWASTNVFTDNIVVASANDVLIGSFDPGSNRRNLLDHNLYFTPDGPGNAQFNQNGQGFGTFAAYQRATGRDAHSVFGDPLFANASGADFHLKAGSSAIDAGSSRAGQFVPVDFEGLTRGSPPDVGAYEQSGS